MECLTNYEDNLYRYMSIIDKEIKVVGKLTITKVK